MPASITLGILLPHMKLILKQSRTCRPFQTIYLVHALGSVGDLEQDCPPLCYQLLRCSAMAKHLETQQHDWGCREMLGLRRRGKHKLKKLFSVPAGRLSRFLSLRSLSNAPPPFQANTNKDATACTQHLSRPVTRQVRFLTNFQRMFCVATCNCSGSKQVQAPILFQF